MGSFLEKLYKLLPEGTMLKLYKWGESWEIKYESFTLENIVDILRLVDENNLEINFYKKSSWLITEVEIKTKEITF